MTPEAGARIDETGRTSTARTVVLALLPIVLLGGLVALLITTAPGDALKSEGQPPIERLVVERVRLDQGGMRVEVMNDGPDSVTIAQVQVDEAYWSFAAHPGTTLDHLGRTTIEIPYPWVEGEAHTIKLVSSTGTTFDHLIAVALPTPTPGVRFFVLFTLIGLYVGVIPVAIGLLWFPWMTRLGRSGLDFVIALTVGLLLFLLVDAGAEGLEVAHALPAAYQGAAVFVFVACGGYLALELNSRWLQARRRRASVSDTSGSARNLARLVAVGIGVHNLSEGLAIGAAFGLGEVALGGLLIVGFALHNTTEGLAIVAPLARDSAQGAPPPSLWELVRLGLIGGLPTIAGAWMGGFVYSAFWSVVFLALGVGAIAQVVGQIVRQTMAERTVGGFLASPSVAWGLTAGILVMYATGMLIG